MTGPLSIHMEAVARHFLGEPSKVTKHELRFGTHGSFKVNLDEHCWFDHEEKTGGGVLDLIKLKGKIASDKDAITWIEQTFRVSIHEEIVATYDYTDEQGKLLYQAVRYEPKNFKQRRPDGRGGWIWKLGNVRLVPFRLPKLIESADRTVHIVEGEKDVLTLEKMGLLATTNPMGVGKWPSDFAQYFRGRDVVIFPDNDDAGKQHAKKIATSLKSVAASIRTVELPDLPPKGDVTDWVRRGGSLEQLLGLCEDAPVSAGANPEAKGPEEPAEAGPYILTSAEFIKGFTPPDYLWDGVFQRGFLYSFTAATGAGKTAIALRLLAHVAMGRALSGHDIVKGKCLMFAGENPDDIRMRWIALSEQMGFDMNSIDVHFIPGVFSISEMMQRIRNYSYAIGGIALVVVDTSAAYFDGEEENSNVEMGNYARRLRALTTLPGNPTAIICCHPVKNLNGGELLPRGGGSFIAEVDGNPTAIKTDNIVQFHWAGKFRGPDFDPMSFELTTVTSERIKDSRGRLIPTVMAKPLSDTESEHRENISNHEMLKLLKAMAESENGASVNSLAQKCGWTSAGGVPNKARVHRLLSALKKQGLVTKQLQTWVLTAAGKRAANSAESVY